MSAFRNALTGFAATALLFAAGAAGAIAQPAAAAAAPGAAAPSFVCIGDKPAILFDSPSQKGVKQFIVARFTPLEVLVRIGGWTKVRDAEGTIGWIENAAIGARRFVAVASPVAQIRAMPSAASALVTEAERGVLFEMSSKADGWIAVTHRDGQSGFVQAAQVFGG
jgi:SH3-like domain-containing protein